MMIRYVLVAYNEIFLSRSYTEGLVQDYCNSIALAMGLLQSYTEP